MDLFVQAWLEFGNEQRGSLNIQIQPNLPNSTRPDDDLLYRKRLPFLNTIIFILKYNLSILRGVMIHHMLNNYLTYERLCNCRAKKADRSNNSDHISSTEFFLLTI